MRNVNRDYILASRSRIIKFGYSDPVGKLAKLYTSYLCSV